MAQYWRRTKSRWKNQHIDSQIDEEEHGSSASDATATGTGKIFPENPKGGSYADDTEKLG